MKITVVFTTIHNNYCRIHNNSQQFTITVEFTTIHNNSQQLLSYSQQTVTEPCPEFDDSFSRTL